MIFSSTAFLAGFLPVALGIYWAFYKNTRIQNIILFVEGLVFYAFFDWKYTLILFGTIVVAYLAGISKKRGIKMAGICSIIVSLIFFKYVGLFFDGIILPVGMSFFVFTASGYLLDVLWDKYEPEKDFISVALFLCFFPVLIAGPILRYSKMRPQINNRRRITFYDFEKGIMVFIYGLFLKLVISDRIAIFVSNIYDTYRERSGQILFLGAVAYSIQIYTDFAGYSYMASAIGILLGFDVPENFRQPYFAISISDFWRRWHISLSSWLRDYVYIPLGGNRKGKTRRNINILITFFVSGIWHGAGWNYLAWALLHGSGQLIGTKCKALYSRMGKSMVYRIWRTIVTFIIVTFFWIFFRADSLHIALSYIKHMLTESRPWELTDGSLLSLGVDGLQMFILFVAILIMLTVSLVREKYGNCDVYLKQNAVVKCVGAFLLLVIIAAFGCYGILFKESNFIYSAF